MKSKLTAVVIATFLCGAVMTNTNAMMGEEERTPVIPSPQEVPIDNVSQKIDVLNHQIFQLAQVLIDIEGQLNQMNRRLTTIEHVGMALAASSQAPSNIGR